jgi:hypothetical protein
VPVYKAPASLTPNVGRDGSVKYLSILAASSLVTGPSTDPFENDLLACVVHPGCLRKGVRAAGGTSAIWGRYPHPSVFVTSIPVAHENLPSIGGNLAVGIGITYPFWGEESSRESKTYRVEPSLHLFDVFVRLPFAFTR